MASSPNYFSIFILLTITSSLHTHATHNQPNKVPTHNAVPDKQETQPNFLPDNENRYGLYDPNSSQLPPSATTFDPSTAAERRPTLHKFLPRNYNPVAYVTQPEDETDSTNPDNDDNNNYYYNGAQNYYDDRKEESGRRSYPTSRYNRNNYNYYYGGGSSFNSQPRGFADARFRRGGVSGGEFQRQGMSDTRFLANGKYFYDINTERYSSNHPYERLRNVRERNEYNNRNYYGNSKGNAYGFRRENSMEEFQDEENYNMP